MLAEEVEKLATKDIVECTEFSEAIATFTYTPRSIPDARTAEVLHKIVLLCVPSFISFGCCYVNILCLRYANIVVFSLN